MKLARLLLQAFGPFTNVELDFASTPNHPAPNLHLIYGPNEAGKSSALRAMTDLRFGIPLRSQDDFLHDSNQLRIAGVFIDREGQPLGLTRRKGRGTTLSRIDVATGQPFSPPDVTREQEQELTGGLERAEFEAMFGLNHERLRQGGALLIKGEGELGAALFEASAGTRGIAAILASLEADAKALYNPHGRATSATINEARRILEEQRQAWRQAQTRPTDWQALHRAHEQAKATLDQLEQALEQLRRRQNELTELRTVEPLLREHDRLQRDLNALADAPDLPEAAQQNRLTVEQALHHAQRDLEDADQEIARCTETLGGLVVEAPLIEHAEAIKRLAGEVSSMTRSRREALQLQATIERTEADLATRTSRIAPGQAPGALLAAIPSAADRAALDAHLAALVRLEERLQGQQNRAEELDREAAQARQSDEERPLPDPRSRQALQTALQDARSLGDMPRQIGVLDREIGALDRELAQACADLRVGSVAVLRAAHPVLDAQLAKAKQAMATLDDEVRGLEEETRRLEIDQEQQLLRQRQLSAAGEVVTAETLHQARDRRDVGWALVRQAYVERSHDAADLAQGFDPARSLPEAFELVQAEADRQADLLRSDAERAAKYEECAARIDAMTARRTEIASQRGEIASRRQELQATWGVTLAESQLPALDPDALGEWQTARKTALEQDGRLQKAQSQRQQLQDTLAAACHALTGALQAVGETATGTSLQSLIDQSSRWDTLTTESQARRHARANAEKTRQAEREKVGELIIRTEAELQSHVTAVQGWHARLYLAPNSPAEVVTARLGELDALTQLAQSRDEVAQQRAKHQAVVEDFITQAEALASMLGEPQPPLADDFADRLKQRLDTTVKNDQQRTGLAADIQRAQQKKSQAETDQSRQLGVLATLTAAAGVNRVEQLPEQEALASQKRQARASLATVQAQLAQASPYSIEELRARLEGRDTVALDSESERCRQDIAQTVQAQTTARHAEEQARHSLEAIDTSDAAARAREAMEAAAAKYQGALKPWARLKLAHALLQDAVTRFRERAQAPMVAAASTYFSLITGGRYTRLVADEAENTPVLLAELPDGKRIHIDEMSEGTADQLYLALRLAALELRRESHPQMPLVLDDVLITSDDARAANILQALARFAEGSQVMVFTHHRHLLDVATGALGENGIAIHQL